MKKVIIFIILENTFIIKQTENSHSKQKKIFVNTRHRYMKKTQQLTSDNLDNIKKNKGG